MKDQAGQNIISKDQLMGSKDNDKLFFKIIEFMLSYHITSVVYNFFKNIFETRMINVNLNLLQPISTAWIY